MRSSSPPPDLVEEAQRGDRRALDRLLRDQYDRLYPMVRRMMGNADDAADACQEALIALVRGLATYDGRAKFSTWAYRVAVNACLDELRRRGRRPVVTDAEFDAGAVLWAGSEPDPEAAAERLDVEAALVRLPEGFRAAVVLRDVCDLDYAEIAEVLGIPPGTVRSRIARGRAALVPFLGGNPAPTGGRRTSESP